MQEKEKWSKPHNYLASVFRLHVTKPQFINIEAKQ